MMASLNVALCVDERFSLMAQSFYIFLGAPGAGKGTLAQLCQKRLGWHRIATGDILRWHVDNDTELGREIAPIMARGDLLSDEHVVNVVVEYLQTLDDSTTPCILDGFPRTRNQAQLLYTFFSRFQSRPRLQLVYLKADDELVTKRILSRLICSNKSCNAVYSKSGSCAPRQENICDACGNALVQRSDDTKESVSRRLHAYRKHAEDLMSYYQRAGASATVLPAVDSKESLFHNFCQAIECGARV